MRHVSRTHRVALDWLFDRINLDPKIQIKYIDTFTRDEWNHLLCLFNSSHFSSTDCSEVMSKRTQKDSGEERVTAKSKPMMSLLARAPSNLSSSSLRGATWSRKRCQLWRSSRRRLTSPPTWASQLRNACWWCGFPGEGCLQVEIGSGPRTAEQMAPKSVSWRCTRCAVCEKAKSLPLMKDMTSNGCAGD